MGQINYGVIHAHTENSMKDSVLRPEKLCQKAAELGAPAVVLTDHGTLTGVFEFMHAAEKYGIQGIPGVEVYVQEDDSITKRHHLLLIPKNYTGYKAISKAVTKSNERLFDGFPCVNFEILRECFGDGTSGHDNVFATSACVGGVLSQILLRNKNIEKEAEKVKVKLAKYNNPEDPAYLANKEKHKETELLIKEEMERRDNVKKIAEQKFKRKEQALEALDPSSKEYSEAKTKLDAEKQESEEAKVLLEQIKQKIAELNKLKKVLNEQCKSAEKTHSQYMVQKAKLDKFMLSMTSEADVYKEAKNTAQAYQDVFGVGNFYIELQYHHISDEAHVMPKLAQIAEELNFPIVACNDIHYAENTKDDVRARQIVSSLRFNRWQPLREGDTEYYIKTDVELSETLNEILPEATVDKAMKGIDNIISACCVEFPKEDHYPKFKDESGESAKERLRRLAREGIAEKYPGSAWTEEHEKRLEYELSVIEDQGYSDYLCIVEDFLNYGRELGVKNTEKVGLSIGPGRGSAVGSLVCYLAGITGIDPMKHDLIFERFLNRERVSMPDIDSDFDINIRDKIVDYVKQKYGQAAVCNIMTKGTLAAKAAVRNVARVTGDERFGDPKALQDIGDAIAKAIPNTPDIKISDVEEELNDKFKKDKEALQIIKDAKLVEGASVQYGMHAAGVIIADNGDVSEYIPLMKNEKEDIWMCQCDMVEAEADAGLLKMDFLGLRNLNIISEALRAIKRNYGISLDMVEIGRSLTDGKTTPYDKKGNVFKDIFAKGKTNSVFQFESGGMKSMLKRFRPDNIDDIILLVAAYRPGPMQYLDDIIAVKHKIKKPEYIIPQMEDVLGATYGYPIYQEQIMQIFNKFAGFSLGESDIIRRYMSKKKTEKFAAYKDKFIEGLVAHGAAKDKAEEFWVQLLDFSKYAFNKSHACAYAYVAFYTAWLKLNYPTEYMTAVLNYSVTEKLPMLISDCRDFGVKVLPPDINESDIGFKDYNGDILFGLGCIKGVKNAVTKTIDARKQCKFRSFKDFIQRADANKTVIEGLILSGAMDGWCKNRAAMMKAYPEMSELYKKEVKEKSKLDELEKKLKDSLSLADEDALTSELLQDGVKDKKIKKADVTRFGKLKNNISEYENEFSRMIIPIDTPQNRDMLLVKEKELIGMYVSGHPLDEYRDLKKERTCTVCEAEPGQITLSGLIQSVRYTHRKKDGAEMAFFVLEDETGSIDVNCFARAYSECRANVYPGNVVSVKGRCIEEESIFEDAEPILKLNVETMKTLQKSRHRVLISVKNIIDWTENVYNQILLYSGNEYDVFVHDRATGEIRRAVNMTVSANIFNAEIPDTTVTHFPEAV